MPAHYQRRARPNLELRHRRYLAVLEIPAPLRASIGRARFVKSLGTDSLSVAERRAAPLIAAWRRRIAEARGEKPDDAAFYRRALRDARTEEEREAIRQAIWGQAHQVWWSLPEGEAPVSDTEAKGFYDQATAVPFGEHIPEWRATLRLSPKTLDVQTADVKRFAAEFSTVAVVTKPGVKRWVGGLLDAGSAPGTVQRILAALRSYWKHLQTIEAAPENLEPFYKLNLARQGGRVQRDDKRQHFAPDQVTALLARARGDGDDDLASLIDLGRWTGCRVEELCSLKVENVHLTAAVPYLSIVAGKTSAAIREVPVHTDLRPALASLIGTRTTGYVLTRLKATKYGDRANAIGKRFSKLKSKLGFGPQFVFHSIRKTVATILKNAGVPDATTADILGHDIPHITYGVYAGAVSLQTKSEALAKLAYPAP